MDYVRVLDTDGNVIDGLFAAGELMGGVHGTHISSGNGITAPLAFGRLAGQQVVLTEPFPIISESIETTDITLADGTFQGTGQGFGGEMVVEGLVRRRENHSCFVISHEDTLLLPTRL